MSSQELDQQKYAFRRLLKYLRSYRIGFFAAIGGMIGYALVDTFFLYQVQPFIDEGLTGTNPDMFLYAPIFVVVVFIFRGICSFTANYCLSWVGSNVVMELRQQLFQHMLRLPVSYHDQQTTGDMISKITYDTEQVSQAASKALLILIREGAFVVGLLFLMFYHSWQLSLVFLVVGPLIAVIAGVVSKRFRMVSKRIQNSMGKVTTTSEQMLNGRNVVVMFGGQEKEQARFSGVNNSNRRQQMKMVAAKSISVPLIQIIASFALAGVLYIASFPSILDTLTPGSFTTIMSSMVMLLRPLKQLTNVNADFQRGMAACASVFALLDEKAEPDTGTVEIERVKGRIDVKNLTFSYANQARPALNDVSFSLPEGKTLAFVGRSGSGKSTIANLLTRFYAVEKGTIFIDDVPVEDYKLASLRKQFALVSQHVTLFNDTIASNIAYGADDATEEQIVKAAEIAHVLEFTDKLPEGLETEIGENGVMLSGGQRQRIAIARAILRNAPILILDEATSALDTESERAIQDALNKLQQGRTCIVIAHRLSTIENADEILVIDSGKIMERGNHKQLLNENGLYAQLHSMQFGE